MKTLKKNQKKYKFKNRNMKNILIGSVIGFIIGKVVAKKSATVQAANEASRMAISNMFDAPSGSCRTCQRGDGSYYMAVEGSCKEFDLCVSHNK